MLLEKPFILINTRPVMLITTTFESLAIFSTAGNVEIKIYLLPHSINGRKSLFYI